MAAPQGRDGPGTLHMVLCFKCRQRLLQSPPTTEPTSRKGDTVGVLLALDAAVLMSGTPDPDELGDFLRGSLRCGWALSC
jgi:hypothetical protein